MCRNKVGSTWGVRAGWPRADLGGAGRVAPAVAQLPVCGTLSYSRVQRTEHLAVLLCRCWRGCHHVPWAGGPTGRHYKPR